MSEIELQWINTRAHDVESRLGELREKLSPQGNVVSEQGRQRTIETFGEPLSPQQVVERICETVKRDGTEAVLKYGSLLDGADLEADQLRVPLEVMEQAHNQVSPELLDSIRYIRDGILEFQNAILHKDVSLSPRPGVRLKQRYTPVPRAGLCVPGGAAAYPSTVLMTAVPAMAAGVPEICVVAPPTEFGAYNGEMLAVCWELGIREVYRMGGAHAVAAMAYGISTTPKVDMIVGPGNLFVALAKKYVFGQVNIDSIAGPSEVIVIADESARPDFVAADLLAQAEHAPGASILVSWDEDVLEKTYLEVQRQVEKLSRSSLTVQSLEAFAAMILVRDEEEACVITESLAPEHLHIATASPEQLVDRIPSAGAAFLGHYSPVALGDYVAGPSHVLPTGGTAKWASGLSANDFLRSGSVIEYTADALRADAEHVQRMADKEGLTAHRQSIDIRLS
jgi:histidinol dehydrogenase